MFGNRDPKELFGSTPIPMLFFTAALPGAVGMLVSSIYGTMDGILVGTYVGELPFAAINLAMPFVIVLFAFGDLIGVGSAVLISIALGENRDDDANNLFTCSCIMNVVLGGVLGLLFGVLAPLIFSLMGAEGELAHQASLYLGVYAAFAPLTTIAYALDNYLRISGRIRRSLFANIFMAVFGALIELVLLGVCGLGVAAAAFSYSFAMVCTAAIELWPFLRGKLQLCFVRPRFSLRDTVEVFRCGVSTFLDNVTGRITSIVMNAVLLRIGGTDAVAICGMCLFSEFFAIPLIYGVLDALQPAVGYNWGARLFDRVKQLELWCFGAAAVIALAYMGVLLAFPEVFARLFMPAASPELMVEAARALRLFALALSLRWFVFGTQSFLVNVGEAVPAAIISVCNAIAFPLPLIWLLSPLGLTGIWLNDLCSVALTSVLGGVLLVSLCAKIRAMQREQAVG